MERKISDVSLTVSVNRNNKPTLQNGYTSQAKEIVEQRVTLAEMIASLLE
jgi:hypothetical protein